MIVGTWNLENLFRWGQADGPSTEEAYDAKLEAHGVPCTKFKLLFALSRAFLSAS